MRGSKIDSRLLCRTLGHAWFIVPAEKQSKYGDPMWLRCERCDTVRQDDVSRGNGELYGRRYVYADNYQHAFDEMFEATPTRSNFRQMLFDEIMKSRETRKIKAVK